MFTARVTGAIGRGLVDITGGWAPPPRRARRLDSSAPRLRPRGRARLPARTFAGTIPTRAAGKASGTPARRIKIRRARLKARRSNPGRFGRIAERLIFFNGALFAKRPIPTFVARANKVGQAWCLAAPAMTRRGLIGKPPRLPFDASSG